MNQVGQHRHRQHQDRLRTYRAIHGKDVPGYLAGFEYRLNRCYDFAAMLPRVGWAAVRTPPMFTVSSNWLRLMRNPDAAAHWGEASRSAQAEPADCGGGGSPRPKGD